MIKFLFNHREEVKVILLFLSSVLFGYKIGDQANPPRIINGLSQAAFNSLVVARNENKTLEDTITDLTDENVELAALLTMQPPEIIEKVEHVVRTKIRIEPVERVRTVRVEVPVECESSLPPRHTFLLQPNFPIASFDYTQGEDGLNYLFNTAELQFDLNLIIDQENTTGLLSATSSLNPDYTLRLSPSITTTRIQKPHQYFDLDLGLGFSALYLEDQFFLNAIVSYLKLTNDISIFSLSYLFNSTKHHLGINVINYNIASHLPVFEDIWIDAGVYMAPNFPWHIGLSSRF